MHAHWFRMTRGRGSQPRSVLTDFSQVLWLYVTEVVRRVHGTGNLRHNYFPMRTVSCALVRQRSGF